MASILTRFRDSALSSPKSRQSSTKTLETLSHHVSYIDIAAVTADLISYTQKPSSFSRGLGTFKPCDERRSESNDRTLTKDLCSTIEERAIWLQKTDQALRDHLTQYGSLLGAKENVRLQRTIRFLTWVILILTVVLSWPEPTKTLVNDFTMVTKSLVIDSIFAATKVRLEISGIVLLTCR